MEYVVASGVAGAFTLGAAWITSAPARRRLRRIESNLGESNGHGPVAAMSGAQLDSLARIEAQLGDVLAWQGRHTAEHLRNSSN